MNKHLFVHTLALLFFALGASATDWTLTVQAGEHDRVTSIVSFTAPAGLRGTALLKADGITVPAQIDDAGHGVFIEPQLARRSMKTYTLTKGDCPAGVIVEKEGDKLQFRGGER